MSKAPTTHMGALSQQEVHPHVNQCSPNSTPQEVWRTWEGEVETLPQEQWIHVAATRYAQRGLKVFPLSRRKKPYSNIAIGRSLVEPRIIEAGQGGFHVATTNLEQIALWWGKYFPGANVAANPPKGVVVVDIDPRNGGNATWEALTNGHVVPDTIVTRTGSDGLHYWFKLPYMWDVRPTMGEGIDLKTSTGYVVMPPSIHPKTGERYLFSSWPQTGMAVLPEWLRPHVFKPLSAPPPLYRPRRVGSGAGSGLINSVAHAQEGQRNSMLHWAARRNAEQGLGLDEELIAAALACGLSESEARNTVNSASRKGGV